MSIEWDEAPARVLNLAEKIIDTYHPDLRGANIAFIIRGGEAPKIGKSGKTKLAAASRFPEKMHALVDTYYHFLIWLAEEVMTYEDTKLEAIIDHELCHCDFTDEKPSIQPHDIEEFNCIIERYGAYRGDLVFTMMAFKQVPLFNAETHTEHKGKVGTMEPGKVKVEVKSFL